MTNWEYLTLKLVLDNGSVSRPAGDKIRELGLEGWELVSTASVTVTVPEEGTSISAVNIPRFKSGLLMFFKRRPAPDTAPAPPREELERSGLYL